MRGFHIHVRCGCGARFRIKSFAEESQCSSCGWVVVYSQGCGALALSRHMDFQMLPATPKRSADNG